MTSPAESIPTVRVRARAVPRLPRPVQRILALVAAGLAFLALVTFGITGYDFQPLSAEAATPFLTATGPAPEGKAGTDLAKENKKFLTRLQKMQPPGVYIVIDRINNRVSMRKGDSVVLEGPCSTGSGKTLIDETGNRQWQFETPRGRFKVLNKIRDPLWKKPDWAFVEEGEPIPRNPNDRIERGVLGEYGLYFGNGYLIHGTLYERLLGRSVSHGCVRVGKENLETIYNASPLGTAIYVH